MSVCLARFLLATFCTKKEQYEEMDCCLSYGSIKQPFSVLWVHSGGLSLVNERSFQLDFLLLSVLCQVLHNVCLPIFGIYDVVTSRAC